MFINKPSQLDEELEKEITRVLDQMQSYSAEDEEYSKMADQLEKLYSIRHEAKPKKISADTLAIVAGNLFGILLIVGFEKSNVLTSKALNFVMKSR